MTDAAVEDLGVSIKKCTEFIGAVHAETQVLLMEIGGIVEKLGFESVRGTGICVSDASTKNIQYPAGWCHRVVARLYGDGGRSRNWTRVLAVEAHLAPSFGVDRAALVLGYASFTEAQDKDALMAGYVGWMASVYDDDEPDFGVVKKRVLGADSDLFPKAADVRVIGWPLVSFDSPEKVRKTIEAGLHDLGVVDTQ